MLHYDSVSHAISTEDAVPVGLPHSTPGGRFPGMDGSLWIMGLGQLQHIAECACLHLLYCLTYGATTLLHDIQSVFVSMPQYTVSQCWLHSPQEWQFIKLSSSINQTNSMVPFKSLLLLMLHWCSNSAATNTHYITLWTALLDVRLILLGYCSSDASFFYPTVYIWKNGGDDVNARDKKLFSFVRIVCVLFRIRKFTMEEKFSIIGKTSNTANIEMNQMVHLLRTVTTVTEGQWEDTIVI